MGARSELPCGGPSPPPRPEILSLLVEEIVLHYKGKKSVPTAYVREAPELFSISCHF